MALSDASGDLWFWCISCFWVETRLLRSFASDTPQTRTVDENQSGVGRKNTFLGPFPNNRKPT